MKTTKKEISDSNIQLHRDQKNMQENWRRDDLIKAIERGESSTPTDIQSVEDFRQFFREPDING